jgi:DNA polymerase III delta prime subunit
MNSKNLSNNIRHHIWSLKYRPKSVDECILPVNVKLKVKQFVLDDKIPNLLFSGPPGLGKTTLAYAIANEVNADTLYINCSSETGIDVVRDKIQSFGTTVSLGNSKKLVILDEFDNMSQSAYLSLRAMIESISDNCSFIATCNFKNRIPDPILSRLTLIDFTMSKKDKAELSSAFYKRVSNILKTEGVAFNRDVVANLVLKIFPDFRKTLNELQSYSASGEIDSGILSDVAEDNFKKLVDYLKSKKFNDVRKWVAENSDMDCSQIYKKLYDCSTEHVVVQSIPQLILILAKYQFYHTSVVDRELNLVACLVEIMADVKFN